MPSDFSSSSASDSFDELLGNSSSLSLLVSSSEVSTWADPETPFLDRLDQEIPLESFQMGSISGDLGEDTLSPKLRLKC